MAAVLAPPPTMAKQQPRTSACILHELEDAKGAPAFFSCTSGELLWGQVHTVMIGGFFASAELDTELGPQEESSFQYRVAARKGQWKAEAAFQDGSEGEPWHVGFVCHHVGVDGAEVLRRAAEAGICSNGRFGDLDVVFVDRHDWSESHSSSPGCEVIVQAVEGKEVDAEEEDFEDEQYYRSLVTRRFMLVDALGFPNLVQALKDGQRIEHRNYALRNAGSSSLASGAENCGDFGTHLVVDGLGDDMGWMVFQKGELIGFVYDGAYSALEGDNLRIGKVVV